MKKIKIFSIIVSTIIFCIIYAVTPAYADTKEKSYDTEKVDKIIKEEYDYLTDEEKEEVREKIKNSSKVSTEEIAGEIIEKMNEGEKEEKVKICILITVGLILLAIGIIGIISEDEDLTGFLSISLPIIIAIMAIFLIFL